jgi:hypothetical protein
MVVVNTGAPQVLLDIFYQVVEGVVCVGFAGYGIVLDAIKRGRVTGHGNGSTQSRRHYYGISELWLGSMTPDDIR